MRKIKKRCGIILITGMLMTQMSGITSLAAGETWKKDKNGWWLSYSDGSYAKNAWVKSGGKWYYFGADGYMTTGWKKISGKWYYFANGAMVNGWKKISDKWYYFANGAMVTGWKKLSGKWYYFANGAMADGWKKISDKWYYFANGAMTEGWRKIKDIWYYFNDGAMVSGTQSIDGKWYSFDENGKFVALLKSVASDEIPESEMLEHFLKSWRGEAFEHNNVKDLSILRIILEPYTDYSAVPVLKSASNSDPLNKFNVIWKGNCQAAYNIEGVQWIGKNILNFSDSDMEGFMDEIRNYEELHGGFFTEGMYEYDGYCYFCETEGNSYAVEYSKFDYTVTDVKTDGTYYYVTVDRHYSAASTVTSYEYDKTLEFKLQLKTVDDTTFWSIFYCREL